MLSSRRMSISNNPSDTDQEDAPPATTTPEFDIPPLESTEHRIATTPEATEVRARLGGKIPHTKHSTNC